CRGSRAASRRQNTGRAALPAFGCPDMSTSVRVALRARQRNYRGSLTPVTPWVDHHRTAVAQVTTAPRIQEWHMSDSTVSSTDEERLAQLGYQQELHRRLSGFSNFAVSFSIISILAGAITSYGIAMNAGGPMAITL